MSVLIKIETFAQVSFHFSRLITLSRDLSSLSRFSLKNKRLFTAFCTEAMFCDSQVRLGGIETLKLYITVLQIFRGLSTPSKRL